MDKAQTAYARWCAHVTDAALLAQLHAMDADAVQSAFARELSFGTGGLRGILGAGTDRMNVYVVRRATQGLADYMHAQNLPLRAAIAHDSRLCGREFAEAAACVLAANGIRVFLYPRLEPTPALSFAVRHFSCGAGICVTASHNPAQYNGYKVYGPDGCQITLEAAAAIEARIARLDCFEDVKSCDYEAACRDGRIEAISDAVLAAYVDAVYAQRVTDTPCSNLKIVYTPLCGSGLECAQAMFRRLGVTDVTVVPSQRDPDGHFPTCPYPNPEIREAMEEGLKLCEALHPDLLIDTDPDCDRCGVAARTRDGGYRLISGNEMGALLLNFLCMERLKAGTMPEAPVAVTTVVSTGLADRIAENYGVELRRTLTGFKYIGEQIGLLEREGRADRFIFGFEESYGYLSGTHVRDKDGVNALMLICQMTSAYKRSDILLPEALEALYARFGRYENGQLTHEYPGTAGAAQMREVMRRLREKPPERLGGAAAIAVRDYALGLDGLPKTDMLELRLEHGRVQLRPSGTEPKLKCYLEICAPSQPEASARYAALAADCRILLTEQT